MFEAIGYLFGTPAKKKVSHASATSSHTLSPAREVNNRQLSFVRPFRWTTPPGQSKQPDSVEIVGSFTDWQKVPLAYDKIVKTWHVTLHGVVSNRTHHYVLLVDGKPTYDKTCDGLAVPHGPEEKKYPIQTEKGPRVMMLFGQAK